MPKKICNNIEGHRVLDGGSVCEDVTSITLPNLNHPTSPISGIGLAIDIDIPNSARLEAMEFGIAHNNGVNCGLLQTPGVHSIEVRAARQEYQMASGEIGYGSIKWRVTGAHKGTEKGNIEMGNPYGSTEKYSVTRYEEIVNGVTHTLIDTTTIMINGKNYTDPVENILK